MIKVLSKDTIDKIAAGEVIERPSSVVKELVENSIDAGSTTINVEIKNGGIDLIRVADNGHGIKCDEVRTAFLRHATGKITDADDLMSIHSLGFRGEALSSIAAVSRTEIVTKTKDHITAVRYVIEGGNEISYEEIGGPDGTSIIARDLFYNVPVRKKFLKTGATEGSHVAELVEKLALSHPYISFRFISNGQTKLFTSGNGQLKDIVYQIYGRDITGSLTEVDYTSEKLSIHGLIGKPEVSRPNRNFESYFINGRYIKSSIISKAIEDGYEERMMQHQFPFAVLIIETNPGCLDINVHPTKMEVRFSKPYEIYDEINNAIKQALNKTNVIPHVVLSDSKQKSYISESDSNLDSADKNITEAVSEKSRPAEPFETNRDKENVSLFTSKFNVEQLSFKDSSLTLSNAPEYRLIGQVFSTYWLIEYNDKFFIVDQHAAHEKIYYERLLKQQRENGVISQILNPPMIITLTDTEADIVHNNINEFKASGYEIEHFGGNEYAIRAIPAELPSIDKAELLKEMIAEYTEGCNSNSIKKNTESVLAKTASMACKAAIKGGQNISFAEANILLNELLRCDNPYCCPHGRPTMIEFTKQDIEKKFKRIV